MKIGLLADLHYSSADADFGDRRANEGLKRLSEFLEQTRDCDFLISLGDIINGSSDEKRDLADLKEAVSLINAEPLTTYHVLGNHDVSALGRDVLIRELGIPATDYSFLRDGVRLIVMDANFARDGEKQKHWWNTYIGESRLIWLKRVLKRDDFKCAVLICHECFDDRAKDGERDLYTVENSAEIRAVLEENGRVPLVLSGHCHEGRLRPINGIMYYTQPAACIGETVNFGILRLDSDKRYFGVEPHGIRVTPYID